MNICHECNRQFEYKRNKGGTKNRCNSCQQKLRRDKIKKELVDFLGGKCSECGYNKSYRALCFHHKDPTLKEFDLSQRNLHRTIKKLKEEASKCILLCSNCHMELHGNVSPHSDKV